jgi:hypothetical protein
MRKENKTFQLIWGIALVLMGFGVFYRLPQVWPDIEKIEFFSSILPFIRFCFYVMAIILIGGGSKKIYENFIKPDGPGSEE